MTQGQINDDQKTQIINQMAEQQLQIVMLMETVLGALQPKEGGGLLASLDELLAPIKKDTSGILQILTDKPSA